MLGPRDELTSAALNARNAAARRAVATPGTSSGLALSATGRGRAGRIARSRPILATLSGTGPAYSFTEAIDVASGATTAGPRTGTAREVNGVTGLAGDVVRAYPDRSGGYRFQSVRFGSGGPPPPDCGCALPCGWTSADWSRTLNLTWYYTANYTDLYDSYGNCYPTASGDPFHFVSDAQATALAPEIITSYWPTTCQGVQWSSPVCPVPLPPDGNTNFCEPNVQQYVKFVAGCGLTTQLAGQVIPCDADGNIGPYLGYYGAGPYHTDWYGYQNPGLTCSPFSMSWSNVAGFSGVFTSS